MDSLYLATFFVALISSMLSGIAGSGGSFIMTPYWLLAGMSPAQGATTGAFTATGMMLSSLAAFRNTDHLPRNRRLIVVLSAITLMSSVAGALILPHIAVEPFKYLIAGITLVSLPLLFIKPSVTGHLGQRRGLGLLLVAALLIISSVITSSAFSILLALTIVTFFNMSVLQTTALRRLTGAIQSIVLFVLLAAQGYFLWQHALMGLIGGSLGSYLGTAYAIRKGEVFAKYALAGMSLLGVVALVW